MPKVVVPSPTNARLLPMPATFVQLDAEPGTLLSPVPWRSWHEASVWSQIPLPHQQEVTAPMRVRAGAAPAPHTPARARTSSVLLPACSLLLLRPGLLTYLHAHCSSFAMPVNRTGRRRAGWIRCAHGWSVTSRANPPSPISSTGGQVQCSRSTCWRPCGGLQAGRGLC